MDSALRSAIGLMITEVLSAKTAALEKRLRIEGVAARLLGNSKGTDISILLKGAGFTPYQGERVIIDVPGPSEVYVCDEKFSWGVAESYKPAFPDEDAKELNLVVDLALAYKAAIAVVDENAEHIKIWQIELSEVVKVPFTKDIKKEDFSLDAILHNNGYHTLSNESGVILPSGLVGYGKNFSRSFEPLSGSEQDRKRKYIKSGSKDHPMLRVTGRLKMKGEIIVVNGEKIIHYLLPRETTIEGETYSVDLRDYGRIDSGGEPFKLPPLVLVGVEADPKAAANSSTDPPKERLLEERLRDKSDVSSAYKASRLEAYLAFVRKHIGEAFASPSPKPEELFEGKTELSKHKPVYDDRTAIEYLMRIGLERIK